MVRMTRGAIVSALFAGILVWSLAAQEETPTFKAGVSLVRVDADVAEGPRPVMGLTRDSFHVFDNGVPRELSAVTQESVPLDLILLFDVSASMKPGIRQVSAGAREALGQLRKGDRVSVMVFTTRLDAMLDFTDDLKMVEDSLREDVLSQRFLGGTDLRSAIFHAGKLFEYESRTERRRAIIVVTDNRGQPGGVNEQTVVEELWKADAVVNGLILNPPDAGSGPAAGPNEGMDRIAGETGGEMLRTSSPEADFRDMMQRLRLRYSIYYPMPEGAPGELRQIRVELAPEARKGHLKAIIRARKGYRLPESAAPTGKPVKPGA